MQSVHIGLEWLFKPCREVIPNGLHCFCPAFSCVPGGAKGVSKTPPGRSYTLLGASKLSSVQRTGLRDLVDERKGFKTNQKRRIGVDDGRVHDKLHIAVLHG